MVVLVTGASGRLGRVLVPVLRADGHDVREAGRKGPVILDLAMGSGLADAIAGAGAVVHAASSAFGDPQAVDVAGTGKLCAAARSAGVPHLVHLSIVGIEQVPTAYYRAKVAAEREVIASGAPHTILRATQFHVFVDEMLAKLARFPLWTVPGGWQVQPVDETEVARAIAECVAAGPRGRVEDLGGPDVVDALALARTWAAARSSTRCIHAVPVPGAMSRAMRSGALCCPERRRGRRTFGEWLAGGPG